MERHSCEKVHKEDARGKEMNVKIGEIRLSSDIIKSKYQNLT
jgi:hypothetical protein